MVGSGGTIVIHETRSLSTTHSLSAAICALQSSSRHPECCCDSRCFHCDCHCHCSCSCCCCCYYSTLPSAPSSDSRGSNTTIRDLIRETIHPFTTTLTSSNKITSQHTYTHAVC